MDRIIQKVVDEFCSNFWRSATCSNVNRTTPSKSKTKTMTLPWKMHVDRRLV